MAVSPNDYPLGRHAAGLVRTPGGVPLERLTLEAARAGELVASDLRASAETLRRQSEVARAAGRDQLADNLERAAELAEVPEEELLQIYTALRPRRATVAELERWAARLEERGAVRTAAFVREAAAAYRERDLLAV
jgi:propanediol dehydratase small subunit